MTVFIKFIFPFICSLEHQSMNGTAHSHWVFLAQLAQSIKLLTDISRSLFLGVSTCGQVKEKSPQPGCAHSAV